MKYFFISIIAVMVLAIVSRSARAAEVGFVPASGIWFSKQTIAPGETVKIYAVIINNAYPAVQANVAFYDNGDEMGIIKVAKLEKEQARELWLQWTPQPGVHKISARFIRAAVIGADGKEAELDTGELNTIGESSFLSPAGVTAGGSEVVGGSGQVGAVAPGGVAASSSPITAADIALEASAFTGGGITVQVKKKGENLLLNIVPPETAAVRRAAANENAQNEKIETTVSKNTTVSSSAAPRAASAIGAAAEKIKNVSDSVRDARDITARTIRKARSLVELGRFRAEAIGQTVHSVRRNKIALAWGGFLAFIGLAAVLSYVKWKK